jgi:hypothetical protein
MRKRNGGQINNRQAARSKVGRDWQRSEVPPRSAKAHNPVVSFLCFSNAASVGLVSEGVVAALADRSIGRV